MEQNKIVSIIIPAYNVEMYIEQCLRSVIGQSYRCIEAIVIDDGSSDSTQRIVSELARRDGRIRLIPQVNLGVSAARNRGIIAARGDYVFFLDADDWLEPNAIEKLVQCASESDADIVCLRATFHYGTGDVLPQAFPGGISCADVESYGPVLCGMPTFTWNYFYKRSVVGSHRYDPEVSYAEDCLFIFQVADDSCRYGFVDEPLYNYRVARSGSALASITPDGSRSIKQIKGLILTRGKELGCYENAAVQYGSASFGLLRKTARNKAIYYQNCSETAENIAILLATRSARSMLYALACKMPRLMRPLFIMLGMQSRTMRIR